ncbi:MAG: branched-chain amino acid ABC transporter permease [Clostridiales bacterium]|nr:branched-chain amino acid ABC transporter permease [Clostridiales bacterium]
MNILMLGKLNKTTRTNFTIYGMVIAVYIIMQVLISGGGVSSSLKGQLVPICAYIVMAVSLNLTVGILGELSLGHAGFMSIGAFAGVIACMAMEGLIPLAPLRLGFSMIIAAFCAGLAGFLIGIPILRVRGDYLAIVTLAFGEIIKNIINCLYVGMDNSGLKFGFLSNIASLNLGEGAKVLVDGPMGIAGIKRISTFSSGFVLVMITLIIVLNLINSKPGRAIMALRDNRIAAESLGIPVTKYKLMAFVTSSALAGAAGALFAMNFPTIVASKFNFSTSILVLVFVVLGGLGNIGGSIIAAAVLTVLPEMLRGFSEYRMLAYAVLLVLVMIARNNSAFKYFFVKIFKRLAKYISCLLKTKGRRGRNER